MLLLKCLAALVLNAPYAALSTVGLRGVVLNAATSALRATDDVSAVETTALGDDGVADTATALIGACLSGASRATASLRASATAAAVGDSACVRVAASLDELCVSLLARANRPQQRLAAVVRGKRSLSRR